MERQRLSPCTASLAIDWDLLTLQFPRGGNDSLGVWDLLLLLKVLMEESSMKI